MNDDSQHGELDPHQPISIREAARLAGVPREYLEECVASGKLGVHLHHKGDVTKFRVTLSALVAAGILPDEPEPTPIDPNEELVALLKSQTERLALVEEQRFQLAGQLGAALERNRMLEERALALAAAARTDDSVEQADAPPSNPSAESLANHSDGPAEPPVPEPTAQVPYKLAVRIIRLKPAAGRWSVRTLRALPVIGPLIEGRRNDAEPPN